MGHGKNGNYSGCSCFFKRIANYSGEVIPGIDCACSVMGDSRVFPLSLVASVSYVCCQTRCYGGNNLEITLSLETFSFEFKKFIAH